MSHVLIGKSLILKVEDIVSANLNSTCKDGKECIKVTMSNNVEWTIWANLIDSRKTLRDIPTFNKNMRLVRDVEWLVNSPKVGRESILSKKLKELFQ